MSDQEPDKDEYVAPAITRRETLATAGASGGGAAMLAGSMLAPSGHENGHKG